MAKGKARQRADRDNFGAQSEAPGSASAVPTSKKKREAPPKAPQVSPASVAVPPAPIPEELAPVWDDSIAALFAGMKPQHQSFLLVYLREGNAAEAYRKTYNPMAKDHLAAVCGSQVLATTDIQSILAKFASYKTEALFTVIAGYREMAQATKPEWVEDKSGQWVNAGDAPDWQARKEAFIGIRKIHGLDAAEKVNHTGKVEQVHSGALTVNVAPIAEILNGPASK